MNEIVGIKALGGKSNASGLRRVRLICVSDLLEIKANLRTWTVPVGGIVLAKKNVVELKFSVGSYTEEMVQSQFGDAWQCTIEVDAPRDDRGRSLAINSWRGKTFVGLTKDKNGVMKVVGNKWQALRFMGCRFDVQGNAWKFSFGSLCKEPSFYADSIDVFNFNNQLFTL